MLLSSTTYLVKVRISVMANGWILKENAKSSLCAESVRWSFEKHKHKNKTYLKLPVSRLEHLLRLVMCTTCRDHKLINHHLFSQGVHFREVSGQGSNTNEGCQHCQSKENKNKKIKKCKTTTTKNSWSWRYHSDCQLLYSWISPT